MKKLTTISTLVALCTALAGCFESGSETTPPPAVPLPPTGIVLDGKTYYSSNCGTCHKAGTEDTTAAFGASDLAQKQDMIVTNMGDYDLSLNLMTAFSNVPSQRVLDLRAFLQSVQPAPQI